MSRLNSKYACYYSAKNISFHLSRNVNIKIYKIILFFVLNGCETWSLTLREKHRLVLRRIFEPKKEKNTWRKLHNK